MIIRTEAPDLSGTTVLVVEDEFYLAMDIRDAVEGAGGRVIGPCQDSSAVLSELRRQIPDCAVVDINLGNGASFEITEELQRRQVPFLFLTGYDAASIPPELARIERIEKPSEMHRVLEAITRLAGS